MSEKLKLSSPAFENGGKIPIKHTGFGEDVSPAFHIGNLSDKAVSVAIIMDDLDIPLVGAYNHWLVWNIPAICDIPEAIPHGAEVGKNAKLSGAMQGIGYGKNRYRGPKQPFFVRGNHRYLFSVYSLDCKLSLDSTAVKEDLIKAMKGHILQKGEILGNYKRGDM